MSAEEKKVDIDNETQESESTTEQARAEEEVSSVEIDEQSEGEKVDEIDWQDKYVRLHAEWDNYRKRLDEQRADERVRATERLMSDLLVCIDDLQRTIDYATKHGEGDLIDGVKAVSQKFTELLGKNGLEEIDPKGEPFDPLIAQAIGTVDDDSVYEETVCEVLQKGYRLGIKVLRPAMVTYSVGGEKRPTEPSDEQIEDKAESEDVSKDGD